VRLLSRLSLAQQVMLIVALGLIAAQALNFTLAVRERQAFSMEAAAAPAIARLVDAVDGAGPEGLRERRWGARARLRASAEAPIRPGMPRLANIEALARARLAQDSEARVRAVRAALVEGPRGNRFVIISVQTESGTWLTSRARGPAPVGPLIWGLAVQTLVILAVLLVPLLLLVRSVTRPLSALTRDADAWAADPWNTAAPPALEPLPGPRDVRELIGAVHAMQTRIAAMLREKDVMLGAIGHDLRTPLTALRIQAELVEDDAQRAGLIAEIERLSGDLEGILSLARSSANIARREGDLVAIARMVAAEFRARGAEVVLEERAALPVRVDADAVRRALANLVDNAVRYSGAATIRVAEDTATARLIVEDQGPGIPEDMLDPAAGAFVRIEPSRNRSTGGHGLGLAIVAAIARLHGGALRLANRPEGGLRAELSVALA